MKNRRVRLGAAIAPLVVFLGVGCEAGKVEDSDVATNRQAIVGGTVAPGLAYPWMARISQKSGSEWTFGCGGSLIARDWVLTAAHCVATVTNQVLVVKPIADVQVTIGEYNLLVTESTEQTRAAAQIIVHPGYVYAEDANGFPIKEFNDIALIRLASPVQLNNFARIIKLTFENDGFDEEAWLSGWGGEIEGLGIGTQPAPLLKQLPATIVNPTNGSDPDGGCNARMQAEKMVISSQRLPDPATEICTINYYTAPEGYQSACFWDSGSPWVTYESGCAEQVGVHTFGDINCVSYNIGTRVSAYLPWIREQGVDYVGDRVYEAESMFHATGGAYPGGWNIWDNNYISFTQTFNGGQQQMVVRAAGAVANGVWPRMRVTVGSATVYEANVTSASWANHSFTFTAPYGSSEVRIRFLNDYNQGGQDRNLFIDKATVKDARTSCGYLDTIIPNLRITNDWGSGYCAEIDITNSIGLPTTNWTVVYDTKDSNVTQSWNPANTTGQGLHTAVPVENWLKVIQPNQTRTLGFCANRIGSSSTLPEVVSAHATY